LVLINLDAITHHPQLKLFETSFPATFELFHPAAVLYRVGYVYNDLDQIVSIKDSTIAPVTFNLLRLITKSASHEA
jgi:hypothetical protein